MPNRVIENGTALAFPIDCDEYGKDGVKILSAQMSVIAYVLAAGFVAAGLLNALHRVVHERLDTAAEEDVLNPGLVLYFDTPANIGWSMFVCVFAGPWLVLSQGIWFWKQDVLPLAALAMCGLLSVIWSFCSGVFIFEVLMSFGVVGT